MMESLSIENGTMQDKFFVGDKVLNLVPHLDSENKLVHMRAVGHIKYPYGNEATVIWWIEEFPYITETKVIYSSIKPYNEV